MHKKSSTKVIVGLSGGVDSSVAAYLLQADGYEVEALFMRNWREKDSAYCPAAKDLLDAQAVCYKLGIRLHQVDFSETYWDNVFQSFLSTLAQGLTPNPDVLCNKEIKFKVFLEHAKLLGADLIATGHYVRRYDDALGTCLLKGIDVNKDQSYFLHQLTQSQLQASLFPIGDYKKPNIRDIAKQLKLRTHSKKDSTGICFIGEKKFSKFLANYLPHQPGDIMTVEGQKVGQHHGLMYYTLGQRQGLNIGGMRGCLPLPWYVVDKDLTRNNLIVAQGKTHPKLMSNWVLLDDVHWISGSPPRPNQSLCAKTRYRQQDATCQLLIHDETYAVTFNEAQWAVTPGQYLVIYSGDTCLGGGVIREKCMKKNYTPA